MDSAKYGKIVRALNNRGLVRDNQLVVPLEAPLEALLAIHTEKYLTNIHTRSWTVAQVTELQPLVALPNWLLQWKVVRSLYTSFSDRNDSETPKILLKSLRLLR